MRESEANEEHVKVDQKVNLPVELLPFYSSLPKQKFTPISTGDVDFTENCLFRAGISGVGGAALGMVFGLFMASASPTIEEPAAKATAMISKQNVKTILKDMGRGMKSHGKMFGICGLLFSGFECVIEKEFARHDLYTTAASGCLAGAVLGASGGPQAACFGCAGFAGFSVLIQLVLDH